MVAVLRAVRPAPLVAEHVKLAASVSLVTFAAAQPLVLVTPLSGSLSLQVRATFEVYQPSRPSVPVMVGLISGGVASSGSPMITVCVAVPVPPRPSAAE